MIILKVTKNQDFTLSLEDTFFEKPKGRGRVKLTPPCRFRVKEIACAFPSCPVNCERKPRQKKKTNLQVLKVNKLGSATSINFLQIFYCELLRYLQ